MDDTDRMILGLLQDNADRTYAELGEAVHLSAPAAHERVRKLRNNGTIRRTTIDIDPVAVGKEMLVFALIESGVWCGDQNTTDALLDIDGIESAYAVAGKACILITIRVRTPNELQDVLRKTHTIEGVTGTESIVVLDTLFERPMSV